MIIKLVRHMETHMNQKGQLQGSIDSELNEVGLNQSRQFIDVVDLSNVEVVYTSRKKRAMFLGNLIKEKYNIKMHKDERINEIYLGEWEGSTWKEVTIKYEDFLKEWYKDSVHIPAPQGESYIDLQNRVMSFINELSKKDYKEVVVVTHGAVIKTIICTILNMDLKDRSKLVIDNGSITTLEIKGYKKKILHFNTITV